MAKKLNISSSLTLNNFLPFKKNDRLQRMESGQRDLNPRPTGPKPVALAKLRYTPIKILHTIY